MIEQANAQGMESGCEAREGSSGAVPPQQGGQEVVSTDHLPWVVGVTGVF